MTTNQEGVHLAVRDITGTALSYNEDWHALFDAEGITAGTFNERMLGWINATLAASYTNINEAMQAFAVDQGFANWASMNTFAAESGAEILLAGRDGLAIDFRDNSLAIIHTATPANNYLGPIEGKIPYTGTKNIVGPSGAVQAVTGYSPAYKDNVPLGQWIESARTNLFVNPRAPATQSVTVTAVAHTLTFYGTGTITLSGVSTAGPLVGTGANNRVTLKFTPTAGSLTLTCSGSLDYVNLEAAAWATTPITSSPRAADALTLATSLFPFNAAEGVVRVSGYIEPDSDSAVGGYWFSLSDGTTANSIHLADVEGPRGLITTATVGQFSSAVGSEPASGVNVTMALAYAANNCVLAVDGTLGTVDPSVTLPGSISVLKLGARGDSSIFAALDGIMTSFLYLPSRPLDADVQAMSLSTYTPES